MTNRHAARLITAGFLSLAASGSAYAGGLERGGYDIDLLFDPGKFAASASTSFVMPERKLNNVVDTNALDGIGSNGIGGGATNGVRESADYLVPRFGFKAGIGDHVDCLADYSQPWGAHTNPGNAWMGVNANIETEINSNNWAATCSYRMGLGKGQVRFIGGAFYQELDGFKIRQVAPAFASVGDGTGRLDISGSGVGWRLGAAYEIPEIALRASVLYNSAVNLGDLTGNLDLRQYNGALLPAFGNTSMPQTLEMKFQTGIAPGWLAMGSVKWVNWSALQVVSFCSTAIQALGIPCTYQGTGYLTSLDFLYRDGWTLSGGIGHKFNDQWSAQAGLAWDRGTTTGLSTRTDIWTLSAGAAFTPAANTEFRLGGALGILTGGSVGPEADANGALHGTDVSYNFGNALIAAVSGSVKVRW